MGRAERRARDRRYGARVRRVRLNTWDGPEWVGDHTAWFYRKGKSIGCSCRRKHKGNPKIIRGMCHGARGYHPSVRERIVGRRLCRALESWVREYEADDFCEARLVRRRES